MIDPKREYNRKGYNLITRPEELRWQLMFDRYPILYQPREQDFADPDNYDRIFKELFKKGNLTCYIDEIAAFSTHSNYPHYMAACYHMGRSRKIRMLGGTQLPSGIPISAISMSFVFYVFALNEKEHQRRVQSYCKGYDADALEQYEFWYYRKDFKTKRAVKLIMPPPRKIQLAS